MNAWRIVSLTLWGLVLLGLLSVSVAYYVLDQSVMNHAKMKQSLEAHHVYALVRTEEIIPQLVGRSPVELGNTGVFTRADFLHSLEQVITEDKVKTWGTQVTNNAYEWLNKKRPDLTFSIDLSQEKQQLLTIMTEKTAANVKQLPECRDTLATSDNWRGWTCLPYYTDVTELTYSLNTQLTSGFEQLDGTLTNEDIGLTARQLGTLNNAPDYFGYLWAANFVTLPLVGFIALYLIVKRHWAGVITIGAAMLFCGIALLIGSLLVSGLVTTGGALTQSLWQAIREVLQGSIRVFGGLGIIIGLAGIAGGSIWMNAARRRVAKNHFTAENITS